MTLFNTKTLLTTSLIAMVAFVSNAQATELVKIESVSKTEIAIASELNLVQSIQAMQLSVNTVQTTAKSLLAKQVSTLDNKPANNFAKVTLVAE